MNKWHVNDKCSKIFRKGAKVNYVHRQQFTYIHSHVAGANFKNVNNWEYHQGSTVQNLIHYAETILTFLRDSNLVEASE